MQKVIDKNIKNKLYSYSRSIDRFLIKMSIKSSLKEINREGKKTKQFELQRCNKAETCSKGSKDREIYLRAKIEEKKLREILTRRFREI